MFLQCVLLPRIAKTFLALQRVIHAWCARYIFFFEIYNHLMLHTQGSRMDVWDSSVGLHVRQISIRVNLSSKVILNHLLMRLLMNTRQNLIARTIFAATDIKRHLVSSSKSGNHFTSLLIIQWHQRTQFQTILVTITFTSFPLQHLSCVPQVVL